jgi:hypothetical protein
MERQAEQSTLLLIAAGAGIVDEMRDIEERAQLLVSCAGDVLGAQVAGRRRTRRRRNEACPMGPE